MTAPDPLDVLMAQWDAGPGATVPEVLLPLHRPLAEGLFRETLAHIAAAGLRVVAVDHEEAQALTEADLRSNYYFGFIGDWEEWRSLYDRLPVCTRSILQHFHGGHDGTALPYDYCPICCSFREVRPAAAMAEREAPDA
jgi:hypothetical protein